MIRHLLRCTRGTAVVEAAIFAPLFVIMTLGVTDIGSGMFFKMTVNAATQSGAAYALVNSGSGSVCQTLTTSCASGIDTAINEAVGGLFTCTPSVCSKTFAACTDPAGGMCFVVTVNYLPTNWPILPSAAYSWAQSMTLSSISTVRVQ